MMIEIAYSWLLAACLTAGVLQDDPAVAIVIDDLGNQATYDRQALALDGEYSYAFLPFAPHTPTLAAQANRDRKVVIVHLPMEAQGFQHAYHQGTLTSAMDRRTLVENLKSSLAAVPHAIGANNHMGSRLTAELEPMRWVMTTLKANSPELFFVDSRTTEHTVAKRAAQEVALPYRGRDVFLDHDRNVHAITRQLNRLIEIAYRRGFALGIAHPYPETLAILEAWQPSRDGVRLLGLGDYFFDTAKWQKTAGTCKD